MSFKTKSIIRNLLLGILPFSFFALIMYGLFMLASNTSGVLSLSLYFLASLGLLVLIAVFIFGITSKNGTDNIKYSNDGIELYRKGVDREIIREVLDETDFEQDDLVSLIERKYGRYLGDEKGLQKTINGLLRMGYSYGEIRDALKVINENLQSEDEVYYD